MADAEFKQSLDREREALQQARDELKLQLHLGKAEVKKEWDRLERKWEEVETELQRVGQHARQPLEDMGAAARDLIDELKSGYAKIRNQITR